MLIGELARETGVSAKALRFYEAQRLLPAPARTPAGYRDYRPAAIERVAFIRRAQGAGLTLAQIGEILAIRDGGQPPCDHVAVLVEQRLAEVAERLDELERTRDELRALRKRLDDLDPSSCREDEICAAVGTGLHRR